MQKAVTAQPNSILGEYIVGLAVGALSWLIPQPILIYTLIVYTCVVGLTMFLMVATDTEHPLACGTALGVSIGGWSLSATLTILVSAIILAAAYVLLAKYLKDLV